MGIARAHRLKRQRLIRPLFDRTRRDVISTAAGCIRIIARVVRRHETGEDVPVQVGFSAGGRARRAVDRNRIKRIMREVYRRHQAGLAERFANRPEALTLMILFRSTPGPAEKAIEIDLPHSLEKLALRLGEAAGMNNS